VLKSTRLIEGFGRMFMPMFSGVMVVSAKKALFPAVPRRKKTERFVRVPAMSPQAAMELPPEA
jgi:hypothetical protein